MGRTSQIGPIKMLRGGPQARVDDKGRLKIPSDFIAELDQICRGTFYITSSDGQYAWIYPMPEWNKLEERIANDPSLAQARRDFLKWTNYYGQVVNWDKQGRLVLPQKLREAADLRGEVAVLGNLNHLAVWNNQRYQADLEKRPVTPEVLDALGI